MSFLRQNWISMRWNHDGDSEVQKVGSLMWVGVVTLGQLLVTIVGNWTCGCQKYRWSLSRAGDGDGQAGQQESQQDAGAAARE